MPDFDKARANLLAQEIAAAPLLGALPNQAAVRAIVNQPIHVPPGYGMRVLSAPERSGLTDHKDHLLVWEPRSRKHQYVIGVDVSNGEGLDRSVVDVTRVGTLERPDEQVAQFVSDSVEPIDLAYVVAAVGKYYRGSDGLDALVAIECNGFGLGVQAEIIRHIGYNNLFVWQYEDAATMSGRYTQKYGWWTSVRTRPLIIQRYLKAVKTLDPNTGQPDYRINSEFTIDELQDFQTPTGVAWQAEAAPGAHDDCIMAGAIGVHVSQTVQHDSQEETVSDGRKRLAEERRRAIIAGKVLQTGKLDYINSDATIDEMHPDGGEISHY